MGLSVSMTALGQQANHPSKQDRFYPPGFIREMLKPDKCVTLPPPHKGPKQVCYPEEDRAPIYKEEEIKKIQDRVQKKITNDGVSIDGTLGELAQKVPNWLRLGNLKCEGDFAKELIKNGLDGKASLNWAEASVFTSRVKTPQIYLNADPSSPGGGILAILPKRNLCTEQASVIEDLKSLHKQWEAMLKMTNLPHDNQTTLAEAMDRPDTVFTVLSNQLECYEFREIGKNTLVGEKKTVPAYVKQAQVLIETSQAPLAQALVNDPVSETDKKIIESAKKRIKEIRGKLAALKEKGIDVTSKTIVFRNHPFSAGEVMSKMSKAMMNPKLNAFDAVQVKNAQIAALDKFGNDWGISGQDLYDSFYGAAQLEVDDLEVYRKSHPLPSNQFYINGPNGEKEIYPLGLGCKYYDEVGVQCGGMGGGGSMGFGM